jgi:hypothetical protein
MVFAEAVIVAENRTGTDVAVLANGRISDVLQVGQLAAGSDHSLLCLDKVADAHTLLQHSPRPQVDKWPGDHAIVQYGTLGAYEHQVAIPADLAVF